jgi:membrane-bound lytic murein transglycosylase D
MTESPRMRLIAVLIAGWAGTAASVQAGDLQANRALILTDKAFSADRTILDQACLMAELLYRLDGNRGLIFDPENPGILFGRVSFRNLSTRAAQDSLARAVESMRVRLAALASEPASAWSDEQISLRRRLPADWTPADIEQSARRLTGRRGMRSSFRASLQASLPYLAMMDSAFLAEGVPTRLKYLAHVESRFDPEAVSPAGAAGIWQFLKSSGSLYLTIDDRIDQRFDPDAATRAAARYLRLCRNELGSWPLAILAYNAGPGLIREAAEATGSREAGDIIRTYRSGAFGPVSRGYYGMFLAVSSLAMQADKLYPGLRKARVPARAWKSLTLEHEWTPRQLRILSGYSTAVLKRYNPALRPIVFEKNLTLPKGYALKLPIGLPSRQDLQFSDLRIAGAGPQPRPGKTAPNGLHLPGFAQSAWRLLRETLFPERAQQERPVMAYMHSLGLLDADRLALAKEDRILIEPHPALQAVLQDIGG